MLKKERQDAILSTLNRKQFCSVSELAGQLYVAPITIRRDLVEMEASGLLKRWFKVSAWIFVTILLVMDRKKKRLSG
jgi:DeoR/GlpR family transcriptional regulator of sugar metabolism